MRDGKDEGVKGAEVDGDTKSGRGTEDCEGCESGKGGEGGGGGKGGVGEDFGSWIFGLTSDRGSSCGAVKNSDGSFRSTASVSVSGDSSSFVELQESTT